MSKYMLPSEIKTETQMMSWLYLGDFYRWVCRVFLDILRAGSPNAYHAIHDLECADWADSYPSQPI